MTHKEHWSEKAFLVVAVMATLFVLLEMLLQSYGKSICGTAGCRLVAKQTRFGDLSILLVGLGTFSLLSGSPVRPFFAAGRTSRSISIGPHCIARLRRVFYRVPGFPAACCMRVLPYRVRPAGRAGSACGCLPAAKKCWRVLHPWRRVFVLFYLVLPVDSSVSIPPGRKMVLFYSAGMQTLQGGSERDREEQFPRRRGAGRPVYRNAEEYGCERSAHALC